jgi:HAMP domain-containing protein
MNTEQRLRALEQQLADLRARLPKHSVPAAMILELESLEDEIERLRLQPAVDSSTSQPQKQLP